MARKATKATPIKTKRRLPEKAVAAQLIRSNGNISHAARALGLDRSKLHDRIQRTDTLKQVLHDAREEVVDIAESGLLKAVKRGHAWAICFVLKTVGRERGYIEKQEQQQSGSVRVIVEHIHASNQNDQNSDSCTASSSANDQA